MNKSFTPKMLAYCQQRAIGLKPGDAARAAGYLISSAAVTASRLDSRTDVQTEIARIKKQIKAGKPVQTVGGDSLSDSVSSPLDPWKLKDKYTSPLDLMIDVMNNPKAPIGIRVQCAKDAMPYVNARKAESGKKQTAQEDAEKAVGKKSRFATQSTPMRRVK